MYFQIQLFRITIINWKIPASIVILFGILSYKIDFKNFKQTYFYPIGGTRFYAILNYIFGFGFIACSMFMLTNYYFADQNVKTESYEIVDRTWLPERVAKYGSEKKPVFTINYKGENKELVFYSQFYEKMDLYKTVEFKIRDGFFGFEILENKKLNE